MDCSGKKTDSDIKALIAQMTLKEKCSLLSGKDFWHTKTVERLGIPNIMVSDGPHGLRKQDTSRPNATENESIKAVCFPTACATASSFDRAVYRKLGETLGDECQAQDVSTILGPAINIKRSPLCGRNFEYLSEDPYLTGELAASYINGVQSKGVGTSLKHFALNNQEYRRLTNSSNCDERTMREIYLSAFETAVKKAQPATIMHSYNLINGTYTGENEWLLKQVLRKEWGFLGVVMSDWGAVNDRAAGVAAGEDLEMPSSGGVNDAKVELSAAADKSLEKHIDESCFRILRWVYNFIENRQPGVFDFDKHHEVAREIEEESIVLLKNDGAALPLAKDGKIAVIGAFADKPRFQGGGSSHITTEHKPGALKTFEKTGVDFVYAAGYTVEDEDSLRDSETAVKLRNEALAVSAPCKTVVVFAGLPDSFESEGYDRKHLNLPDCQNALIEALCEAGHTVIVVLHNGSPVIMPWRNSVQAILEAYLGGEAVGEAVVNVLLGNVNPSGKLPETFPLRLEDTPSFLSFANDKHQVNYTEGIFVGYRWYDARVMDVQYPFGHGLSYTTFEYSDLKADRTTLAENEMLTITVKVKNTGSVAGKEVIQLYVADKTGATSRPPKELKGFEKVSLEPGETKEVTFTLDKRSFAWYSTELEDWYAATGDYEILVGASSRDIRCKLCVRYESKTELPFELSPNVTIGDLFEDPRTSDIMKKFLEKYAIRHDSEDSAAREAITDEMIEKMLDGTPLRSFQMMGWHVSSEDHRKFIDSLRNALK